MITFLAENLKLVDIPQNVKNTIIRSIEDFGPGYRSFGASAAGLALVALQKKDPSIILDESNPIGVLVSTHQYREQVNQNVEEHFTSYASLIQEVYDEFVQVEAETYVKELVEELLGSDVEIESWSVIQVNSDDSVSFTVSGNNLTGEAPVEEHNPATCEFCRPTNGGGSVLADREITSTSVETLDVEAQADNIVVSPVLRTGCGENS